MKRKIEAIANGAEMPRARSKDTGISKPQQRQQTRKDLERHTSVRNYADTHPIPLGDADVGLLTVLLFAAQGYVENPAVVRQNSDGDFEPVFREEKLRDVFLKFNELGLCGITSRDVQWKFGGLVWDLPLSEAHRRSSPGSKGDDILTRAAAIEELATKLSRVVGMHGTQGIMCGIDNSGIAKVTFYPGWLLSIAGQLLNLQHQESAAAGQLH